MPSSLTAVQNGIGSSVSAGSGAQASTRWASSASRALVLGWAAVSPAGEPVLHPGQDPGVEAEASKGNHWSSTLQKGQTS